MTASGVAPISRTCFAGGRCSVPLSVILVSRTGLVTDVPVRLGAGGGLTHSVPVDPCGLTCTRSVARPGPRSTSVT